MLQVFLKSNLLLIKNNIGSGCSFLSYLTTKKLDESTGEYKKMNGVRARLKNTEGGFDNVELGYEKPFNLFTHEDFQSIYENLKNRTYGRKETV